MKLVLTSHSHARTLGYIDLWPNPELYFSQTWEVRNDLVSATEEKHKATKVKEALSTPLPVVCVSTTATRLSAVHFNTQLHTIYRNSHREREPM